MRGLKAVTISVNSRKGSKRPEVRPVLRPASVFEKVRHEFRLKRHYSLRDKMLARYRQDSTKES